MEAERTEIAFCHTQRHAVGRESVGETEAVPSTRFSPNRARGLARFPANSTLMDRLGVPLKLRQERLGHSDPSLTLGVYTHVVGEDDLRFAEQLDTILRPNAPKKENGSGEESPKPLYLN